VSWPWAIPFPESAIFNVGLTAVETADNVPLTDPEEFGEKVTVKVMLSPPDSVVGKLRPLMEKPAPLIDAAEMVSVAAPELVSVSVSPTLLPFCTLPKEMEGRDAASVEEGTVPVFEANPPQPVSEITAQSSTQAIKKHCDRKNCNGPNP